MELRLFWNILWRRRRLFTWVFLSVFLSISLLSLLVRTQYTASTKIYLYKSPTVTALYSRLGLETSSPMPSDGLSDAERETYLALATTRPVINGVIDKLHLTRERKSVLLIQLVPFMRTLMETTGLTLKPRNLTYEEFVKKSLVHMIFPRPYISADLYEDSDLLEFSTSGDSIEQAVAMANAAAWAFAEEERKLRRGECDTIHRLAEAELPKAKAGFEKALEKLTEFRRRAVSVDMSHEAELLAEKLFTLDADRETARINLIKAQSMARSFEAELEKRPEYKKSTELIQRSSLIDAVKTSLRDLYLDLAETKTKYTSEHPAVRDIENRIAEAGRMLKNEKLKTFGSETISVDPVHQGIVEKTVSALVDAAALEAQDEAYGTLVDAVKAKFRTFAPKQAEQTVLQSAVDAQRTLYENLMTVRAAAAAGEIMDFSIIRSVEPARIPGKISDYKRPKLSLMGAAALFLGVFLGLCAALFVEYVDDAVKTRRDVEDCGGALLGILPDMPVLPFFPNETAGPEEDALTGEAFRFLQAALERKSGPSAKTFVLAATDKGEADARTVIGLAARLARSGKRTLLVDAAFRPPNLVESLRDGLHPQTPGMTEFVREKASFEDIVQHTAVPGFYLVPCGAPPEVFESPVESEGMARFLVRAAAECDAVLVRAAPAAASHDAGVLASMADALLLTAEYGGTPRSRLRETLARFDAQGADVLGVVLYGAPLGEPTASEVLARIAAGIPVVKHFVRSRA